MDDKLNARERLFTGHPVYVGPNGEVFMLTVPRRDYFAEPFFKEEMEREFLRWREYRCPFDFWTEFDQWFEWKSRVQILRQRTGDVTVAMVADIERIKAHQLPEGITLGWYASHHFGVAASGAPSMLTNITT